MRSLRSHASVLALTGVLTLGLAACGGGEDAPAAEDVEADVFVTGTDSLKFEPSELEAEAGEVTIALTSESLVPDVVIEEAGDTEVVEARGGTQVGSIELEPGTYTFYCSVPGHREAGMEGTLTVG